VQSLAAAEAYTPTIGCRSRNKLLVLLVLCTLWFILWWHLSSEWSVNEQYNYGWFVPFLALYLFWCRWQDRPEPSSPRKTLVAWIFIGVPALLSLLPLRLFEIANPDWRLLSWLHAASVVTLTLLCIWSMGGRPWLRHFAFPVAFIFVAVPWVTPVEAPIIQGLMRAVASVAAETITLFGMPAQLEGNLIRLTSGLVGVNEACSGIRSLQTSLMIGLLFGELKRLSISRRIALVIGAIAIALVANFLRAVFLVWVAAAKSIAEVNRWHDVAGYTIAVLVFVGILILASLLSHGKAVRDQQAGCGLQVLSPSQCLQPFIPPTSFFLFALCWMVVIEVGAQVWYLAHEQDLVLTTRWNVRWPEAAPNFHELKIDKEIRRVLRFDEGQAAVWTSPAAPSPDILKPSKSKQVVYFLYLFHWKAGRNSAVLANLHRPDVCLPAIGWVQVADTGVRDYPVTGSFSLPFRHFEFRHGSENSPPEFAHAFYCLTEDRIPAPSGSGSTRRAQMAGAHSTWTRDERIRQVLEGRRHLGQQVMEVVFVSSNPISATGAESRLHDLVRDVVLAQR
jgi:exosortase